MIRKFCHFSEVVDGVVSFVLFFLPESQVLLKKLDNALGITEVVLFKFVDLIESFLESLIGELNRRFGVLHGFVVEDREVKGKAKFDWIACWE